jgi:hypothetical protein
VVLNEVRETLALLLDLERRASITGLGCLEKLRLFGSLLLSTGRFEGVFRVAVLGRTVVGAGPGSG